MLDRCWTIDGERDFSAFPEIAVTSFAHAQKFDMKMTDIVMEFVL
jgi:hypothetical protein